MSAYLVNEETGTVIVPCRMCGKRYTLNVNIEHLRKWQKGTLIQDALTELDKDQRELLISNTCGDCWNKLFASDEEEEDDKEICIYHATVINPEISLEEETPNRSYLEAMRDNHIGDTVKHFAGAPGIGYIEYMISRMDETGVWGYTLRNTVRELRPEEVE